jgi:general stress protein 26
MAPASKTAPFAFEFIANSESGKFDEVDSHSEVNVSFYDQSTTDWISVAGNAHSSSDKARIKGGSYCALTALWIAADLFCSAPEIFNPMVSAWFGDLGDGVHDGSASDPRVELIVVEPTEIRYWKKTQTNLGQLANVAVSAVTGQCNLLSYSVCVRE